MAQTDSFSCKNNKNLSLTGPHKVFVLYKIKGHCVLHYLDPHPHPLYHLAVQLVLPSVVTGNKQNRHKSVEQRQQRRQIAGVRGQAPAVPAPHSRRSQTKRLPTKPTVPGQHGRLQHREHGRFFVTAEVHAGCRAVLRALGGLGICVFGGPSLLG